MDLQGLFAQENRVIAEATQERQQQKERQRIEAQHEKLCDEVSHGWASSDNQGRMNVGAYRKAIIELAKSAKKLECDEQLDAAIAWAADLEGEEWYAFGIVRMAGVKAAGHLLSLARDGGKHITETLRAIRKQENGELHLQQVVRGFDIVIGKFLRCEPTQPAAECFEQNQPEVPSQKTESNTTAISVDFKKRRFIRGDAIAEFGRNIVPFELAEIVYEHRRISRTDLFCKMYPDGDRTENVIDHHKDTANESLRAIDVELLFDGKGNLEWTVLNSNS